MDFKFVFSVSLIIVVVEEINRGQGLSIAATKVEENENYRAFLLALAN